MIPLFAYSSDELRVMLRPRRTYRRLAEEVNATKVNRSAFWCAFKRPIFAAFMIGAFASFTSSGRLSALLVIDGMLFWSFIPLLQVLIMAGLLLVFARHQFPAAKAIDLFFLGHGPWYLWLLIISGSCLFLPAKQIYLWPVQSGWIMPATLLLVWAWSNVTTFGFLRGALNLPAGRAAAALLVYVLFLWGIIISYLFAIETLQLHRLRF
jgi:hypothetical protein